ncbi:MAG: tetratricopeptide repeat protein, partial [Bacteroidia bacterium]|nr:tetratricopeptide repeat protein [Bacteroidia bacterium]
MKWKTLGLLVLFIGAVITTNSQSPEKPFSGKDADTTLVNNLLQQSKEQFSENPEKAISLANQAKDLSEKVNFQTGKAYALKNIGIVYYIQGDYLESLQYWNESLGIFEKINDETGVANLLNNIAAIYVERGDDEKALEYSLRSLKISEKLGDKLRILSALNTVGSIYYNKKATWDKALDYLIRALPLCEEVGTNEQLGTILGNIG